MSLYVWLNKWGSWSKRPRRPQTIRPRLEPLEDRLVLDTRVWSGGDPFSSNWSALFNWQNGAIFPPSNPVQTGDSVDFPDDASRRTNFQDLPVRLTRFDPTGPLILDNLHIEGGNYDIDGSGMDFTGKLSSDSDNNTIRDFLVYLGNQFGNTAATIDVGSGSLSLTNELTSLRVQFDATTIFESTPTFAPADLIKTGAGTLKVSSIIGEPAGNDIFFHSTDAEFDTFFVKQGLVSLEQGGQLWVDPHIEDGGTIRLHENEQILGPAERSPQIPDLAVDAGGVLDLNGHSQSADEVTLDGQITTGSGGTFKLRGNLIAGGSATSSRIDGRLNLSGDRIFGVANGTALDDLVVNGVIDGPVTTLTKIGAGQLVFSGSSANTYTGSTFVNEGNLKLDKPDAVLSLAGALIVGDGLGGVNADRVILFSDAQIAQNAFVRVNSSGLLALNGHTNALDGLTLAGGNVSTGTLGLLTLVGNVTSESAPTAASISGHLSIKNVSGIGQLPQPRFFDVADSVAGTDLLVSAVLEDGSLTKTGPGTMELTAVSPTSGDTIVNVGQLLVNGTLTNSLVRLNKSGTLTGDGIVNGISVGVSGGRIQPGEGVGTLTSTDNVILQPAASFQPQLTPITGDPHDVLKVQGTVNLGGAVLAVQPLFLTSVTGPHQFVIVDNDSTDAVQGTFAGLAEGAQFGVVATNGLQQQKQVYTISYRANDRNDVGLTYVTTATAAENLQITPSAINEGQSATLTGHLTDPDAKDFLTLTIDWGDGQSETHHPATENFQFAHRYLDNAPGQPNGAYTVHLTWFDQHGAGNSRDLFVTVHNVAPTIVLPGDVTLGRSGLLVVAGYFTDPGVNDRWTATVDYGDGSGVQPLKVNPAQRFVLQHRYQRPGTYQVTVTITDDSGEFEIVTLVVHVDALPHP